jgi:hypothetical protein
VSRRDPVVEARFLHDACRLARQQDRHFARRVLARLDGAGQAFGRDLPDHLSVEEVLAEAREETEDIGGWTLMAMHLARERDLLGIEALQERLVRATAFAAMADREIAEAIAELGEVPA